MRYLAAFLAGIFLSSLFWALVPSIAAQQAREFKITRIPDIGRGPVWSRASYLSGTFLPALDIEARDGWRLVNLEWIPDMDKGAAEFVLLWQRQ